MSGGEKLKTKNTRYQGTKDTKKNKNLKKLAPRFHGDDNHKKITLIRLVGFSLRHDVFALN